MVSYSRKVSLFLVLTALTGSCSKHKPAKAPVPVPAPAPDPNEPAVLPSMPSAIAFDGSHIAVITKHWKNNAITFRLSTDNGATWGPVKTVTDSNEETKGVSDLILSGTHVYAINHLTRIAGEHPIELLASSDSGDTWRKIKVGDAKSGEGLAQLHANGPEILLNYTAPTLFSADGGDTWNAVKNDYHWTQSPETQERLYFSDNGAIFSVHVWNGSLSLDHGKTWTEFSLTSDDDHVIPVSDLTMAGEKVYVLYSYFAGGYGNEIWTASFTEKRWSKVVLPEEVRGTHQDGGEIKTIFATGSSLFLKTKKGIIYLSTDNGSNWKKLNDKPYSDAQFLTLDNQGRILVTLIEGYADLVSSDVMIVEANGDTRLIRAYDFWPKLTKQDRSPSSLYINQGVLHLPAFKTYYRSEDLGRTWTSPLAEEAL